MSSSLKIILILLLVLGISYDVYRWHEAPAGAPDAAAMAGGGDAAPVGVAVVIGKDVQLWNEFSGRLTAVDQSEVRPQVGGVIESVHFTDGAKVSKGDLLFTIDQRPYAADLDRAKGVLASATATATLARKEASRADRLVKDKAISEHDFDQRKSAADVADANQKSAQAAFETAQLNFDYTTIRAPIAGRAGRVEITAGNLVQASPNAPLLTTIVSDGTIYADFDMDEVSFLQYIHSASGNVNNIPVELGLAAETGTPHTGHIQSFDNRINTSSGTIRVRAVFDNADGALVPGMFARLLVGSAGEIKALLISDRAVGTDQDKQFVLVVGDDGKVEYRIVRLGPLADGLRVVEEGLKAGEKIIVSGLQRARPGSVVKPEVVAMDARADAKAKP